MLILENIRNVTFSYERLVKPQQSISIKLGYLVFPRIIDDTILDLLAISGRSKNGINIGFDYRYYPLSRNRRAAPDGLFIAAFISYYGFQFKNNFDILNTTVDQNGSFTGNLNIFNAGIQLGYQFLFWKRLSVDLILLGPCLSYYSASLKVSGDLDAEEIKNINHEVVNKILSRFPVLKTIFSSEGLEFTGHKSTLNIGYTYAIQIGFAF